MLTWTALSYIESTWGLHSFHVGSKPGFGPQWCPHVMMSTWAAHLMSLTFFFTSNISNWPSVVQISQKMVNINMLNSHGISVGPVVPWGENHSAGTWTYSTLNNQNFLFVLNFHVLTEKRIPEQTNVLKLWIQPYTFQPKFNYSNNITIYITC